MKNPILMQQNLRLTPCALQAKVQAAGEKGKELAGDLKTNLAAMTKAVTIIDKGMSGFLHLNLCIHLPFARQS